TAEQFPGSGPARAVVRRPVPNPLPPGAEPLPGGVPRVSGDRVQHDEPDRRRAPGDVVYPRRVGRLEEATARQLPRLAGGDGVEPHLGFGQPAPVRAEQLAVVDVASDVTV
ncbi:hypothetical protein RZS08_42165, partial [Arthrospira platensis SPKY1]|nr:hypothetical protein [Arthrospira platensis SPKY1]